MLSLLKKEKSFTPEEYLEFERKSVERHEFIDGEVYQMAGESLSHSRICINLMVAVGARLRGNRCEALSSNMKTKTSTASLFAILI